MILSDVSIREALACGRIKIDPAPEEEQFDTSSLDLRLGSEFRKYSDPRPGEETIIDPSKKQYSIRAVERQEDVRPYESDGSILVKPGNFVLGMTEEWITLPSKSRIAARANRGKKRARPIRTFSSLITIDSSSD